MSDITPVEGFMTTDGTFFPAIEEAMAHQHVLDTEDEIQAFATDSYSRFDVLMAVRRWEEHKKLKQLKGE